MFGSTPLIMVEDDATLRAVVETLSRSSVIALDTEADSFHHYQEKLCLIQLSDLHADYIVDPLKVPDLSPLAPLFADPSIVKVLHGGDYDVVSLKRDHGMSLVNVFDTMIGAQFAGLPRFGLADLIDQFFGVRLDKRYQRHDWALRPLEDDHLDYARGDTHWLLALREVLITRLRRVGRLEAHAEECEALTQREWGGRSAGAADFLRVKHTGKLDDEGLRVLRAVWRYRDGQARDMDRPTFKVLPDEVLAALAQERPTTRAAFDEIVRPGGGMARRHGEALFAAVQAGLADTEPLPEPEDRKPAKAKAAPAALGSAAAERLMLALKAWRNGVVDREGLAPVVVANNDLLKSIARLAPRTLDELAAVPGARKWQVGAYGAQILAVVSGAAPPEGAAGGGAKRGRRRRR